MGDSRATEGSKHAPASGFGCRVMTRRGTALVVLIAVLFVAPARGQTPAQTDSTAAGTAHPDATADPDVSTPTPGPVSSPDTLPSAPLQAPDSSAAPATDPGAIPGAQGHDATPVLQAAPLAGDIDIDGRLDEPAWAAAPAATEFRQLNPNEGELASERTEVRILLGDDALYVGARLFDSRPEEISARLVRRDEEPESDLFEVTLDSYHDHLTAFRFRVTPAGARGDAVVPSGGEGEGEEDLSWDPIWKVWARVDSLGWMAEMRIPLSQLRYNPRKDIWGIQLQRFIHRKQEEAFFAFTPKSEQAGLNRYGHLTGLGEVHKVRRLEILPYTSARAEYLNIEQENPFRDDSDYFGSAGVDLKYGLTSDLTLDATVNPDFGQVEVDPAVVNLSAFETFFDEKRPFFIEGADVFRFGSLRSNNSFGFEEIFHARRIGRAPQRLLEGDDFSFVEAPALTTIAGAAKLTGKTSSGWSVGVLDAVTTDEKAQYLDALGAKQATPVEPLTNYFTGRLRRDLRRGDTVLGGIATAVHRDLDEPAFGEFLRSSAYVGGIDMNHAWGGRRWSLDGFVAATHVRGSEAAIAATQRSSARYYQRPDADYKDFDPTRTSLSGYTAQAALQKGGGEHWLGSLTYQARSPGFEVNDAGFINQADRHGLSTIVIYKEDQPGRFLRNWDTFAFTNTIWNFGGETQFSSAAVAGNMQFHNYWDFHWRGQVEFDAFDDRVTRGGPLARYPGGGHVRFELGTDPRKPYTLRGIVFHAWDNEDQSFDEAILTLDVRPTSSVRLSIEPYFQRNFTHAQFVTSVNDPLASATFGRRHVFATLDQRQLSIEARLDWTFTPQLSLQLFAQPLVAAGDYTDLKEFRTPRTYDFDIYGRDRGTISRAEVAGKRARYTVDPDGEGPAPSFGFDDPSFNFRSLRGNAVLRWEYRPGSTLFFVWQQQRTGEEFFGEFDFGRDYGAIFDAPAENVFAIKATYWLGG